MEVRRRKATEKELEQGLREMRKAQERLEREEKENEELPLEDGKVEGQVEGEERLEIEDDPKRLLEGQGESEGKSTLKPPKSSPAAPYSSQARSCSVCRFSRLQDLWPTS